MLRASPQLGSGGGGAPRFALESEGEGWMLSAQRITAPIAAPCPSQIWQSSSGTFPSRTFHITQPDNCSPVRKEDTLNHLCLYIDCIFKNHFLCAYCRRRCGVKWNFLCEPKGGITVEMTCYEFNFASETCCTWMNPAAAGSFGRLAFQWVTWWKLRVSLAH